MQIHFHGAAQTVTGSQYVIEINGKHLMLECGLFQGKRNQYYERNLNFPIPAPKISAVLLSHAHIDHSGNLPYLVRQGFSGPIYATPATARLTEIMLLDSGHIQEADAEFVNKKRARRGEEPIQPLYTQQDALQVRPYLTPIPYEQPFEPLPGVTAQFFEAGHILGSASICLTLEEKGQRVTLWFSGDIGREKLPLLKDPILPFGKIDYLLMESTYGDKPHRDPDEAFSEFSAVVQNTADQGGKIIIPAFAVGRTQELVYCLHQMVENGSLPPIPIYVDSPLAVQASMIFQEFPDYFDDETQRFIQQDRHPALSFEQLHYVQSVEESKKINDMPGPLVIISASGMAETGRILHHLRNNIENPRNTIVIVSWQAPDTLGRQLAERATKVKIFGETFQRRAKIATIGGLSAHAGQDMLIRYAQAAMPQRNLFLIHGEPNAATTLAQLLTERQLGPIHYPSPGSSVDL
jgi:metallo-beta-lactamase family protein